jgi:release factor glutamine methyltransferase
MHFIMVVFLCTDVNPDAAKLTNATARQKHVFFPVEPLLCDFATALEPRLHGTVDVLMFNPPYVVSPAEEVGSQGIEAAWAGGRDGRVVVDRLLESGAVGRLLSAQGVFYLVAIQQNRPMELIRMVAEKEGLHGEIALERRAGIERLYILRFQRRT